MTEEIDNKKQKSRLKELSFATSRQLAEFVNLHGIEPGAVESILPAKSEKMKYTLVYWEKTTQFLAPLQEGEPSYDPEEGPAALQREKEIEMPTSPKDYVDVSLIYEKSQISTYESMKQPETIEDYLDRKDEEREKMEQVRSAFIPPEKVEKKEESEEEKVDVDYLLGKWEIVLDWWFQRFPETRMNIAAEEVRFTKDQISVPKKYFGNPIDGDLLHKLGLVVEAVYGETFKLEIH